MASENDIQKLMVELAQKQLEDMIFRDKLGAVSTASNEPPPPLTMDVLKNAIALLKKGDPLEQKGIGKDWVCVINPALVIHIKQFAKDNPPPVYVFPPFEIDYVMGRRVFIVNEAPLNVEYMSEKVFQQKYPDHWKQMTEAMAKATIEILEEIGDDSPPATRQPRRRRTVTGDS